jgi:hypothetical protein
MSKRERRVFGSVRRLSSGRWQVHYRDLSGVLHTGPHTFTSKTDAARYLAMVEADLHRGAWADPKLGGSPWPSGPSGGRPPRPTCARPPAIYTPTSCAGSSSRPSARPP